MSEHPPNPARSTVLRIATQEADAVGVDVGDVLGMARNGVAAMARRRAMIRILRETGCTPSALARAWGCDRQIPARLIGREPPPRGPIYDAGTRARLRSRHGAERTELIAAGQDAATNADLARWRRLGTGRVEA